MIWRRCCAASRRTAPHCELTDWLMAQVTLCCYYGCRDLESVLRCIKKNGASLEHLELSRSSLLRMDPLLFRNVLTSATRQWYTQFKQCLFFSFVFLSKSLFYFFYFWASFLHSLQLVGWGVTKLFVYSRLLYDNPGFESRPTSHGSFWLSKGDLLVHRVTQKNTVKKTNQENIKK